MLQGPRQAAHWYLEHHPTSNQSNLIYPLMRPALLPYCHTPQSTAGRLEHRNGSISAGTTRNRVIRVALASLRGLLLREN